MSSISMSEDPRIQQLLEEALDSERTPEEVCRDLPELLPAVRSRWRRVRNLEAQIDSLFPTTDGRTPDATPRPFDPRAKLPQIPGHDVQGVLGHGGMGVVYRARHVRLDRPVAIKMLLAGELAAPQELIRFMREAQAVAGLRHPNIVQVFDVGDSDGRPYFTMELIEGGTLGQKLDGVPQPAHEAAAMVVKLAEAIEAAHRGGVVHRDLKPANVLLTADGIPKISDFGLARRREGDPTLTVAGARVGTPSYMAPEQALGRADAFCPGVDIYALGALLYEMLTGRPPFRAETAAETQRQVVAEDPAPPTRLNARVPRDLETICLKCLHKDVQRRYASAADLAADLERFLRHQPIMARPMRWPERAARWVRRNPAGAGLLVALLALAGLAVGEMTQRWALAAERRVEKARLTSRLESAIQLQQQGRLAEARAIMERLGDGGFDDLRRRIDRAVAELGLLNELEGIRLNRAVIAHGRYDPQANLARADREYEAAFRRAGLAEPLADPARTAARISESTATPALVAALDDWATCADEGPRRDWLLDVANRADPEDCDWRRRVRDPAGWSDRDTLAELVQTASVETQSVQMLVALAERRRSAGGDVVPFLTRVQATHPSDFWANFALGEALIQRGRPGDAVRFYQAALALRPGSAVAHNNLAIALARDNRIDQAMEQFRQALQIDPTFGHAHSGLGNCYAFTGRGDEALAEYREAVRVDPTSAVAHSNLGTVLDQAGRFDEAIAEYEKAVELEPEYVAALFNLGSTLARAGRMPEAIRRCRQAIRIDPNHAEAHSKLGHVLMGALQPDAALRELREALRLNPNSAQYHADVGVALAERGEADAALDEHRWVLALDTDRQVAPDRLRSELIRLGRMTDVRMQWRAALDDNPRRFLAWDGFAELCLFLDDREGCDRVCRQLLSRFRASGDPRTRSELALTLLLPESAIDRIDGAAAFVEGVAAENQADRTPELMLVRGLLELRRGRPEQALTLLAESRPSDVTPVARLLAAVAMHRLGRTDQARKLMAETVLPLSWNAASAGTKSAWTAHIVRRQADVLILPDLPAFLTGAYRPRDNDERFALMPACQFADRQVLVAGLYADAFEADPALAEDRRLPLRYNAACTAALVGCGRSPDAAALDAGQRAAWRARARDWLRAELAAWAVQLDQGGREQTSYVGQILRHCQIDSDLAGLREPAAIAELPSDEARACRALWNDVAALERRARASAGAGG